MPKLPGFSLYNQDRLDDADFVAGFVARNELVESLLATLRHIAAGGATEHQVLIGTRGMGKTSLLRRLAIAIKQDPDLSSVFIPLRFREEQYNIISLDAFWRNCGESLAEYCEQEGNQALADRLDAAIESSDWRDPEKARDAFLSACREAGGRAILLLDNLDLILEGIKPEGNWQLRATLQAREGPIVIGAATQLLAQGADRDAAFYEFFHPHMLEPLGERELLTCLNALADRRGEAGIPVKTLLAREPERIRSLYVLTGGNPRILGLIYQLFEQADSDTIFADLEALLDQVTPFYKARIEEYQTPLQRAVIDGIALNWDPVTSGALAKESGIEITTLSGQLNRLKKDGLIEEVETSGSKAGYQLSERFLNIWYLMRHGTRKTKQRLRWFTIFLSKLFSANELQRMAGDARDGLSKRWNPDHCEAVIEAYELSLRSTIADLHMVPDDLLGDAVSLLNEDDPEQNLMIYDALLSSSSSSSSRTSESPRGLILLARASTLMLLNRYEEALAGFEQVVGAYGSALDNGSNGIALLFMGQSLAALNRHKEAIDTFDQALVRLRGGKANETFSQVERSLVLRARSLDRLGRTEESARSYDEALAVHAKPGSPDDPISTAAILNEKAAILINAGRNNEAAEILTKVIDIVGSLEGNEAGTLSTAAHSGLGAALARLGREEEAISALQAVSVEACKLAAPEVRMSLAPLLILKALAFGELGRFEEMVIACDEVAELDAPDVPAVQKRHLAAALFFKGFAFEGLKELDSALAAYEAVLERFSIEADGPYNEFYRALLNKADVLRKLGRYEDAIEACDQIMTAGEHEGWTEFAQTTTRALLYKAQCLNELERFDEAVSVYDAASEAAALNQSANSHEICAHSASRSGVILFWELNKRTEGLERLERAFKVEPGSAMARNNLIWAYLVERRLQEASDLIDGQDGTGFAGQSLLLAGLDLVSKDLESSLADLANALEQGLEGDFDYSEDLLWYVRIATEQGHGERLIEWFRGTSNADRYAPIFGALVAHVRGARFLLDLNPEVRSVAQKFYAKLSPGETRGASG